MKTCDYLGQLPGITPQPGPPGRSAYQIWIDNGNVGSEQDFLASLEGDDGEPGPAPLFTVASVVTLQPNEPAYLDVTGTSPNLQLTAGIPKGIQGEPGQPGSQLAYKSSTFNWSSVTPQVVNNGAFFPLSGLPLLQLTTNDTGITRSGNLFTFPAVIRKTDVVFRVRLTGTIGGSSGTTREWKIQIRRPDLTTIIDSAQTSKTADSTINNRSTIIESETFDALDPFTTQGVIVGLLNTTGTTMSLTGVQITIKRTTQ